MVMLSLLFGAETGRDIRRKRGWASPWWSAITASGLAGCSDAPSQTIVGSFFPAWMLCAGLGLVAAAACRLVLGAVRLHKYVVAPPLGYLAVAVAVTLFVWLYQFGQ